MSKLMLGVLVVLLPLSMSFSRGKEGHSDTFTDPRDGNTYKLVRVGDQVWMAENLRFKTDEGSWCWENNDEKCDEQGRFYNWATAMKVAPPGWHLPSDEEWKELEIALGLPKELADQEGFRVDSACLIAGKIKLVGEWPREYEGEPLSITNESGFSAVQTGLYANDEFTHAGYAGWWTSSGSHQYAWIRHIGFFDNSMGRVLNKKAFAFPVRCVRDKSDSDDSSGN